MAASDLSAELHKEGTKLDPQLEKRICGAFVKQLEDTALDVQGNSVKCIAKIASKIQETNLGDIISKLAECIVTGKSECRDIYATCLKSIITDIQENYALTVIKQSIGSVINGIKKGNDAGIKEECVDIVDTLFKRFGYVFLQAGQIVDKDQLMKLLTDHLVNENVGLRKKVTACIGSFSIILTGKQLQTLIQLLIHKISATKSKNESHTYIQAIG